MGLDDASAEGSLTPIEQDQLAPGDVARADPGDDRVARRASAGCAAVVERLVLPPAVDGELPDELEAAPTSSPGSTPTGRRCGSSRA